MWFQSLHPELNNGELLDFPSARDIENEHPQLQNALSYDRPDIILCDDEEPILVVERTIEVPSGHNVGQRFARLAAAAQHNIPVIYLGPYAAYKHGGNTQGPRYMNLRLFYALEKMGDIYGTPITIMNWPVDQDYEIIRDPSKDLRMKQYLEMFVGHYKLHKMHRMNELILNSQFEREQKEERNRFIAGEVKRPEQYDVPPSSVRVLRTIVVA